VTVSSLTHSAVQLGSPYTPQIIINSKRFRDYNKRSVAALQIHV